MAYVITVVGAGGKTTWIRNRALKYLKEGKRVCVTTTTHIWPPAQDHDTEASPDYCGIPEASGKLSAPDVETFRRLCRDYDVVLVEGDGSHCMPVKIPAAHEPVIPEHTDEIVVVMGAHAIGRRIDVVCQRYDRSAGFEPTCPPEAEERTAIKGLPEDGCHTRVTQEMLEEIARRYYLEPLRARYPEAEISCVLSRMPGTDLRIAGVLMASGFGRRYGGNKLLERVGEKPLYRHCLDHVTDALGRESVAVVTQYDAIMEEVRALGVSPVKNDLAEEGIAASIRLGTRWALEKGADAVIFFAADMPNLPAREIRMFAGQFAGSGKAYGCMEFGREHTCTNPGAFRLKEGAEKLLRLWGDRGAMRIMQQEPWNIYYYQIPPEYAVDMDTRETLI